MDFPHGLVLTIRSGGESVDKYGDATGSSSDASWGPCGIAPRTSAERSDSRSPAVVTGLTIYGPAATIAADAQVVIPSGPYSGTWDVEGIPGVWQSPFTGWAPGIEVAVKRASSR
jgi:hypothetical protein